MKKILMTSPVNFNVSYEINPWMQDNIGTVNVELAAQQWSLLRNQLLEVGADVIVLPKSPDYCPDAVFTANAGLVYHHHFLSSRFRHDERAAEEPFFIKWFAEHDFSVHMHVDENSQMRHQPRKLLSFEGAGDALFSADKTTLWFGTGFRSTLNYKSILDEFFDDTDVIVRPLELVNPNFYHLDTCFCPLDTGELLWYPDAFSAHSQMVIESWYEGKNIKVSQQDADNFACNAVSVDHAIVMPKVSQDLEYQLENMGYWVYQCDMSEFMKSGGACKCLTLEINE